MSGQTKPPMSIAKREQILRILLAGVDVEIEPVQVSWMYRCVFFLVGGAMLLLPIAYLSLLVLIGHTIYWHIGYWNQISSAGITFQNSHVSIISIAASLLIGPVILLFLIKPLFYRDPKEEGAPQRLKESAEPFLFEYVAAICQAVGSPVPTSIRINCDVNASAGLRRGAYSLFSNDLTLTIGLPLVAGMTIRQLTGILAHEFGHFSQKAGMRASFITAHINYWFWRAVYKRDAWDEALINATHVFDIRFMFFVYALRAGVWLSRQVLFVLAFLGNVVSCLLLRHMEFDADRYEARLVGSNAFGKTTRRLHQLGFANYMALHDLQRFSEEKRLANNLPRLIVSNIPHITPEIRKALHEAQQSAKTGLFDTHPSDQERIQNAKDERTEGGFQIPPELENCPATILFDDFDRVCRHSTLQLYHARLGKEFDKDQVTSTEDLIAERNADIEAHKALDRYFQVRLPIMQPLPISDGVTQESADPKETAQQLKAARNTMLASVNEYRGLCRRMEKADSLMLRTGEAIACRDCGHRIQHAMFDLKSVRSNDLDDLHERARSGVQNLASRLVEFESNASNRLTYALQLLNTSAVAARIPNSETLCQEVRRLVPEALFVSGLIGELGPMRILFRRLSALCSHIDKNSQNQRLFTKIFDQMQKLHHRLKAVQGEMKDHRYPFNRERSSLTLVEYALPEIPEKEELFGLVYVTQELYDKLARLQVRLFARLGHAAEQVETCIGLPPLPEPDLDSKKDTKSSDEDWSQFDFRNRDSQAIGKHCLSSDVPIRILNKRQRS